jgi:hypothetical protein
MKDAPEQVKGVEDVPFVMPWFSMRSGGTLIIELPNLFL